jgi:hypothetical protein
VRPVPTGEKFVLTAAIQGKVTPERLSAIDAEFFVDPECRTLFSIIKSELSTGRPIDYSQIATHLRGEAELTLLSEVTLTEDLDEASIARFDEVLVPMQKAFIERRKREIQRDIEEAVRSGDSERERRLDAEKLELSRMLSALK